jgi:hypothetical protein
VSVTRLRQRSLRPGSLPLAASIRRLPRARWSPSSIHRRPSPNSPHPRALGSPAAGPGGPCRFLRVIWVPHAPSHRIVDRAGPGSTRPQWRGRRRARGVPLPPWRPTRSGVPAGGHPTLHRVLATDSTLAPLIAGVALGAVRLPHGAQASWEGSAIYLAMKLRDSRIRSTPMRPGETVGRDGCGTPTQVARPAPRGRARSRASGRGGGHPRPDKRKFGHAHIMDVPERYDSAAEAYAEHLASELAQKPLLKCGEYLVPGEGALRRVFLCGATLFVRARRMRLGLEFQRKRSA